MITIHRFKVYRLKLWTLSYTVMCLIIITILVVSYTFLRQVGSKSTPKFAIGSTVDSRELVETESIHRGLGRSMLRAYFSPVGGWPLSGLFLASFWPLSGDGLPSFWHLSLLASF